MKDLSIHVTYGTQTTILNCPRTSFLSKIAECFDIEEDEIDIYDRKTGFKISIANLCDVMKVEIKRKAAIVPDKSPQPSTSRDCRYPDLVMKLRDNRTLSGPERKFLVDLLKNPELSAQANCRRSLRLTRNVKIQVNPERLISVTSVATQTDHLIDHVLKKRSLSTNKVLCKSKRLASTSSNDPANTREVMDSSYDDRRTLILMRLPLVSLVKERFPLLFSLDEIQNEIDRIFHLGKSAQFLKNIEKYALAILSQAREDDPLLTTIKNEASSLRTTAQKKYALEVGSILMLSSLLHEDRRYLKLRDHPLEISNLPYIEAEAEISDIYSGRHLFKTHVEGCELCEAPNFKQAILSLIGAYYVFNIQYPDLNWNTFTAFDLLYFEKHDIEDLDDFTAQIIKSVQLKAEASEPKTP